MPSVFVAGATGYLGRPLISALLCRGVRVTALTRAASRRRVPEGVDIVIGDALDSATFRDRLAGVDTFVHLVGVSHPSPWKVSQFRAVDRASVVASLDAVRAAGVPHVVYVSVAHPAPVMREYVAVRSECEDLIRGAGVDATILRPWYVLGPGHRWPYALVPVYWVLELLPRTRDTARRLGLVTHAQMVSALLQAAMSRPGGVRIVEVPEIRAGDRNLPGRKGAPPL